MASLIPMTARSRPEAVASQPICAADLRSRHTVTPCPPAIRRVPDRPQPIAPCWPDRNVAVRSAALWSSQAEQDRWASSSLVSTSFLVDTFIPSSHSTEQVRKIERIQLTGFVAARFLFTVALLLLFAFALHFFKGRPCRHYRADDSW